MASRIYCAILFAIFYFGLADATRTKKSIGQLPGPIQASTNNIRPGSCGQTSVPIQVVARQRIINGNKAKPHSIPWIINLRYTVFKHHCGAALIRVSDTAEQSDIILTAAHCLDDERDISGIEVVAGTHYKTSRVPGEVSVRIAEQVFHPNGGSDFVIVKLTKPIKFSRTIQPICLPEQNETLPFGTAGIAAGWGDVGEHQGDADVELQRVVLKTAKCSNKLRICNRQLHRNVCDGDSGGPFFFAGKKGYTLHGIAATVGGSGCEGTNPAGLHVRVSLFIDWIQDQVKKLTSVK